MLTQKDNIVKIEGILSEVLLDKTSYKNKSGIDVPCIKGKIKVRVDQVINGENVTLEVPVSMFASEKKTDGTPNPGYQSVEKVMNEFKSIAASDYESADRIRITKGQIGMCEYYTESGAFVSFPQISATFVSKIKKEEMKPEASFIVTFMVGQAGYETDAQGIETDRYKIVGMIPQYGGKVDVVPFYALSKNVITAVSQYWTEGETVKATGKLNFSSKVETKMVEVDFGDPIEQTKTINVSEFIITGGSAEPLTGDFALDHDDVQAALTERKARLNADKEKKANGGTSGKAPAKSQFTDLGF